MAICGYNARMGQGIRILFEGMYEAILAKSEEERRPFARVLRRELIEIPQINAVLASGGSHISAMFAGLNMMALAHFKELAERSEPLAHLQQKIAFMQEVERFITTLEAIEEFNQSIAPAEPQTEDNIAKRAARIGAWIQNHYHSANV
jgi:hypothetical protein